MEYREIFLKDESVTTVGILNNTVAPIGRRAVLHHVAIKFPASFSGTISIERKVQNSTTFVYNIYSESVTAQTTYYKGSIDAFLSSTDRIRIYTSTTCNTSASSTVFLELGYFNNSY